MNFTVIWNRDPSTAYQQTGFIEQVSQMSWLTVVGFYLLGGSALNEDMFYQGFHTYQYLLTALEIQVLELSSEYTLVAIKNILLSSFPSYLVPVLPTQLLSSCHPLFIKNSHLGIPFPGLFCFPCTSKKKEKLCSFLFFSILLQLFPVPPSSSTTKAGLENTGEILFLFLVLGPGRHQKQQPQPSEAAARQVLQSSVALT